MNEERDTTEEVRTVLEQALEGREVFVHLNGAAEGVSLPEDLVGSPNVTLKLSYYYRGPLVVGEEQVEAELLFPEGAYTCKVPLREIWGVTQTSGESIFWPEHAPREVLEQMIRGVAGEGQEEESEDLPATTREKPALQAVPRAAEEASSPEVEVEKEEKSSEAEPSKKKKKGGKKKAPPTLTRIK
ncbi:hypothetical protein MRY87_08590 [bacterium]|nr:hypothetical protein [bacterium]